MRIRAQYNATGTDKNPYLRKGQKPSKVAVRVGAAYLLLQVATLTALVWHGDPLWLAVGPPLLWAAVAAIYLMLPLAKFHHSRVHPVIPPRIAGILRTAYLTLVFTALAWLTWATGVWAAAYYYAYWIVPLFTSFSFFMILRQLVQHGNGGRAWLTNSRVFFVHRVIRFCVFPIGQDYHLPHHLFATIPHYRLPRLHELLLEYPEYREQIVIVEGYFFSPRTPPTHPTVLDVLGPAYAPRDDCEIYIDNSVLEDDVVEDKIAILHEGEMEKKR